MTDHAIQMHPKGQLELIEVRKIDGTTAYALRRYDGRVDPTTREQSYTLWLLSPRQLRDLGEAIQLATQGMP